MGERQADGVDGGGIERRLTGDGADAVGAEELLHEVSVMVARTLPWARRARIFWLGEGDRRIAQDGRPFYVGFKVNNGVAAVQDGKRGERFEATEGLGQA